MRRTSIPPGLEPNRPGWGEGAAGFGAVESSQPIRRIGESADIMGAGNERIIIARALLLRFTKTNPKERRSAIGIVAMPPGRRDRRRGSDGFLKGEFSLLFPTVFLF